MSLLDAMEQGIKDKGRFIPIKLKKVKGEDDKVLDPKSAVADLAKFGRLARYTHKKLLEMGAELRSGNVEASPCRRDRKSVSCDFCDYRAACHFDETAGDKDRPLKALSDEDVWELLGGDDNA